jgi:acyl dehydratase
MMHVIRTMEDAKALEGTELGVSNWIVIDQERINKFADATDDHQWIHTDPERCAREFPLGTTCAHGYLTISMIPALIDDIVKVEGLVQIVNYGINKARFRAMVPAGSKIRLKVVLQSAKKRAGALQAIMECYIEMEGQDRPVASAEVIVMYFLEGV